LLPACNLEMSRGRIAILLLYAVLACSACGEKANSSNRERAFQKKRICAELGRERLAMDRRPREGDSVGVTHGVRAEWCFSTEMNTCIYSSTEDVMVTSDPGAMPKIVMSMQTIIDLLTNRTLISVEGVKASHAELEMYERRRQALFRRCQ
jgi:hypothetical protein